MEEPLTITSSQQRTSNSPLRSRCHRDGNIERNDVFITFRIRWWHAIIRFFRKLGESFAQKPPPTNVPGGIVTIKRLPASMREKINQNPIKKLRMTVEGGQASVIAIDLSAFMTDSCHVRFIFSCFHPTRKGKWWKLFPLVDERAGVGRETVGR